ncbi:MAG: terminase family protein [Victivallaceae bacterium]|nr:terminase family protein [Victivallaceae bacterium]
MKYSDELKTQAKTLYLQGQTVPEISSALNIERRTLYNWVKAEKWEAVANKEDTLFTIRKRIRLLAERENKTELEIRELDHLIENLIKLETLRDKLKRRNNADSSLPAGDGSPAGGSEPAKRGRGRNAAGRSRNDFTGIDEDYLLEKFKEELFDYQLDCWEHLDERTRNILKSRQIGMTWYFAREAFTNALLTGDNQIFLSASRAQSDVFREYIRIFAMDWFGIEITGKDKVELRTRHGIATLYFLSTNSATAQSYHGHVYMDEYFWIPKFSTLKKVASAMASQKKWRKTYFSTPSAKSHEAYPMWSGDEYNERMKRADKPVVIFPDRAELRKTGIRGADLQWRRIITIEDAEAGGCDLFNIEQLKIEYSEDEFRQLFQCWFIDDSASVFRFSELEKCLADPDTWKFFDSGKHPPYSGPVWIGYDPSRNRDGACIVVLAAPLKTGGKFYVLEKTLLRNVAWQFQASTIKELYDKYGRQVEYIGIDCTGPGSGVLEMVQRFYPAAEGIFYTPERKTKLVLKAQQVIGANRIEWNIDWSDIAAGFLHIHRGVTQSGQISYFADRSDATGHADAAWAIMHALSHEDFILPEGGQECTYAFSA